MEYINTVHIPSHLAQGADPDEVPVLHPGDEDADEADEGELYEGEEDHHEADHHEDVQSCFPHSIKNILKQYKCGLLVISKLLKSKKVDAVTQNSRSTGGKVEICYSQYMPLTNVLFHAHVYKKRWLSSEEGPSIQLSSKSPNSLPV